uniref:P3 protein n=1 Tax=Macrostomum lignano TaxID=282301 RepID=A0A1I8I1P1_9PLAT
MRDRGLQWQLLLILAWLACLGHAKLNVTFQPHPIIVKTEGQFSVNVTVMVNASDPAVPEGVLRFSMKDTRVARLPMSNETSYPWSGNSSLREEHRFQLTIQGVRLGWSDLLISFDTNATKNSELDYLISDRQQVTVLRDSSTIQNIYRGILITLVVLLVIGMGSAIDLRIVLKLLKRPVGLAVGWFTQFILMPHLGLAVGQLLLLAVNDLDNAEAFAFGILTLSCSPGGGNSNMWTLLFDGDLDLSMTMTFVSQISAMFMMPLWLFAYSRFYIDNEALVPYDQVALNLLQLVIPVAIGVIIKLKWPKVALRITRIVKPFALLFVLFVVGFGSYVNLFLFELIVQIPIIIPFAALVPWLGFLFGFVVTLLLQLGRKQAVAIALETGIQNVGIPILVLQFSMPQPDGSLAAIVPLIVAFVDPVPLYFLLAGKRIRERIRRKTHYNTEGKAQQADVEVAGLEGDGDGVKAAGLKSGNAVDLSEYGQVQRVHTCLSNNQGQAKPHPIILMTEQRLVVNVTLGLAVGQVLLLLVQDLDNASAFACGILTLSCSPGGGSSNMWTLLFDGDLDLSMTMTFVSQVCAMFMMPLWLFAYTRFYISNETRIPYDQVALNLLQLVIPVTLGVLVKLKWPKIAHRLSRSIKPLALLFVLFIIGFGTYINLYLFELIAQLPIIIPFAALLPWLGFLFGYTVAIIMRLGRKQAIAIALEAGIQNIGIPILVLQFSMPQPDGSLAAIVPLIVVLVTPMPLYFLLAGKKIRERFSRDSQYELDGEGGGEDSVDATAVTNDAFKQEGLKSGLTVDLTEHNQHIQHKSTENLVDLERKF